MRSTTRSHQIKLAAQCALWPGTAQGCVSHNLETKNCQSGPAQCKCPAHLCAAEPSSAACGLRAFLLAFRLLLAGSIGKLCKQLEQKGEYQFEVGMHTAEQVRTMELKSPGTTLL